MSGISIGDVRDSADERDFTAQRNALDELGVAAERTYVDHGLSGTNRERRSVGEFEAHLIRLHTPEGIDVARAKGWPRDRQPQSNAKQEAHAVELHVAGDQTLSELVELFGIARSTVCRVVRRTTGQPSPTAEGS